MSKNWKKLSSEIVMKVFGTVIHRDKVEMSNGRIIDDYYTFEFSEWTATLPITENNEVVLVKQYRHGIEEVTLEVPAGGIDVHDTNPIEAAKRELLEESGYCSDDWTYLGKFSLGPSKIKTKFHLYCARNCNKTCEQQLDEYEDIEVVTMPLAEFEHKLRQGEIHDVDTVLAWLLSKNIGLIRIPEYT